MKLQPQRDKSHLSARALEALAFEPAAEEPEHVRSCSSCAKKVQALKAEREAFLGARPFASSVRKRRASRPSLLDTLAAALRNRFVHASLAAAVALVALPLALYEKEPSLPAPSIKTKGSLPVKLRIFVSQDGAAAKEMTDARSLRSGDVIRFGVTASYDGVVYVYNIDSSGQVTRYSPVSGPPATVTAQGGLSVLPGSIELDDAAGNERVVAILSRRAIDESEISRALRKLFDESGGVEKVDVSRLPWHADSVSFGKESR